MFSIFLLAALRFGAFFLGALRGGFFFGSGCLAVSGAAPANLLLRLGGADDFGLAAAFFFFFQPLFPHRHSANAFPVAEHFALFIYTNSKI